MQNLFLKLSQTLARWSGNTSEPEVVQSLVSRIESLEKQTKMFEYEIEKILILAEQVQKLQQGMEELNAISNIVLTVQQQLIEEFMVVPSSSRSSKKGSPLMIFPIGPPDDDDLPN